MLDNYTFVEVPSKYADAVLLAMENVTIKGRKISMEKAKGTGRKKKKKDKIHSRCYERQELMIHAC